MEKKYAAVLQSLRRKTFDIPCTKLTLIFKNTVQFLYMYSIFYIPFKEAEWSTNNQLDLP